MVELVLLVGRLQTENRDLASTAAMWQERARVLADQWALPAPGAPTAAPGEPAAIDRPTDAMQPRWRVLWPLLTFWTLAAVLLAVVLVVVWMR